MARDPRSLMLKEFLEAAAGIETISMENIPLAQDDIPKGHSNPPRLQAGRLGTSCFIDRHESEAAVPWIPVAKQGLKPDARKTSFHRVLERCVGRLFGA